MPKGVIFVNAYYHTPAIGYQPARLREELSRLGAEAYATGFMYNENGVMFEQALDIAKAVTECPTE